MIRPAVGKIIAIHRGDHDMVQTKLLHGQRNMLRLGRIERAGHSRLDVAEGAGAGAGVTHDHEGRVLLVPAFADVGAARFLAYGDEAVFLDDVAGVGIAARIRRAHANPVRLRRRLRIGPVDLLRVARAHLIGRHRIDQSYHEKSANILYLPRLADPLAQAVCIVLPWNEYHVSRRSRMASHAHPLPING